MWMRWWSIRSCNRKSTGFAKLCSAMYPSWESVSAPSCSPNHSAHRVYANSVKEIGWYDIEVLAAGEDPMFGGLKGPHTVFQWHGDTFDLPAGAVQLARSTLCEQQAFRYGATAFGLQFHLEVTTPMVEQWLTVPGNLDELRGAPGSDAEQIRRRLPEAIGRMEMLGNRVLPRFVEMCRTSQK